MNKLLFFLLCLLLAGCAAVQSVKYEDEIYYAPTDPQEIRVFSMRPPRDYIEIGEVSVEAPVYDIVETIEEIRAQVSEMGGEAVILKPQESKGIIIRFKE